KKKKKQKKETKDETKKEEKPQRETEKPAPAEKKEKPVEAGVSPAKKEQPGRLPPQKKAESDEARVKASPVARRVAAEIGVDLSSVKGTGPEGRVTESDVRG